MTYYPPEFIEALRHEPIAPRSLVWIVARDRTTNAPVNYGCWSDSDHATVNVFNPSTGVIEPRNFEGAGTLIQIGDIQESMMIDAVPIEVSLSYLGQGVNNIIRNYNMKSGRIEVFRILLNPYTMQPVCPAVPEFVGQIDTVDVDTPSENEIGSITLQCYSQAIELTKINSDTRSNDSQLLRNPTDTFYAETTTVPNRDIIWGGVRGTIATPGNIGRIDLSGFNI